MEITKELESVGWKIGGFILGLMIVFVLLLFLKQILIIISSLLIGTENATKLVWTIFLTPSQLILEKYGIGLYSLIIIIGLLYLSKQKGKF